MAGDRTDIVSVVADKAAEDPKFRSKVSEAIHMSNLIESDGWKALREHYEKGTEGFERQLAKRLISGEEVSQREIDYYRGAIDVARAIFAHPEKALNDLEVTAKYEFAQRLQQEVSEEALASPYLD